MTRLLIFLLFVAAFCLTAMAQSNQRFPAPLGLDRVLIGTVSKAKTEDQSQKDPPKRTKYVLSSGGHSYFLHGHEAKLEKLLGKKVRVTGNAVGNDVTVDSITRADK